MINEEISAETWMKIERMFKAFKEAKNTTPSLTDDDAPAFLKGYIAGMNEYVAQEMYKLSKYTIEPTPKLVKAKVRGWKVTGKSFKKLMRAMNKTSLKKGIGISYRSITKKYPSSHLHNAQELIEKLSSVGINAVIKGKQRTGYILYKK